MLFISIPYSIFTNELLIYSDFRKVTTFKQTAFFVSCNRIERVLFFDVMIILLKAYKIIPTFRQYIGALPLLIVKSIPAVQKLFAE